MFFWNLHAQKVFFIFHQKDDIASHQPENFSARVIKESENDEKRIKRDEICYYLSIYYSSQPAHKMGFFDDDFFLSIGNSAVLDHKSIHRILSIHEHMLKIFLFSICTHAHDHQISSNDDSAQKETDRWEAIRNKKNKKKMLELPPESSSIE